MNPIVAILSIFIVGFLIASGANKSAKKQNPPVSKPTQQTKPSPTLAPSISPTETETNLQNAEIPTEPTSTPTHAQQEVKPTQTSNSSQSITDWQYPGSSGSEGSYTSPDDPNVITNWYKQKIQSSGMNTTSFVTNNVNGNVNSQLVGSNGNSQIKISITRNNNDTATSIAVSR